MEYSKAAPLGDKYGRLPAESWVQAKEIIVVLIPADRRRPPEHGIAIRCDSTIVPGVDAWINVSRNDVRFAVLHRGGWGDGGGRGHGGTWASGDRWGDRWGCLTRWWEPTDRDWLMDGDTAADRDWLIEDDRLI